MNYAEKLAHKLVLDGQVVKGMNEDELISIIIKRARTEVKATQLRYWLNSDNDFLSDAVSTVNELLNSGNRPAFQVRLKEREQSRISRLEIPSMSGFRNYEAIRAGDYKVSIQGSTGHYCSPRQVLEADEYSMMEIAVFSARKDRSNFLNFNRSSKLKAFPRFNELMEHADGPQPTVFGYVPVDLIQDLINHMEK
jgi:hypothetical protein